MATITFSVTESNSNLCCFGFAGALEVFESAARIARAAFLI